MIDAGSYANENTGKSVPGKVTDAGEVITTGPQRVLTATIANGTAVSTAIRLEGASLISISMPSAWTAANLTFQVAPTLGGTYQDVYDSSGNEVTATAAASRTISDLLDLASFKFLKIRSGTTGTPVNQGAERVISVILK